MEIEGDIMRHLTGWRDWRHWVPAECPGCGRRVAGQGLCGLCAEALAIDRSRPRCTVCAHPLAAGACPDCGTAVPAYDRIVAAFDYTGLGRRLILDYKVRRQLSLSGLLADCLVQAVHAAGFAEAGPPDWIVPVPARPSALRQRGFSPPAEVARRLAPRLALPYHLEGVRRLSEGPRQAALGRADRLRSQAGVYACAAQGTAPGPCGSRWLALCPTSWLQAGRSIGRSPAGARVAVIDDVLTTGATLQAVAQALKAAGAVRVEGWVLARTVRRSDEACHEAS